ncbi:Gfo/Idh/MocA family protein [Armatimonas sp.]|uniref:Gfo/Idh/MocA family protein n=1 Tax=Armatimonas sp. TaxID=1872638 RepID=UPI0037524715
MTNLAFIGCAHIHTPGFIHNINRRTDSVHVKYVWDHDLERAGRRAAELPGSVVEGSLEAILADTEIAAVIVCTETDRHKAIVPLIAAAGKHVFVEKPLGFSGADAKAMAEAIESAGVLFSTGYFSRGDAKLRFVKEQIEKGNFGKITRARMSNCHSGALGGWFDGEWRWMADPSIAGCGGFGDLGTHVLDILLWLFGPVAQATGQLDSGTARYEGCDETGEGMLRFKNGVIATLAAAWDDIADPVRLLVSGTEGHAAIIQDKLYFQSKHVPTMDGSQPVRTAELPGAIPAGLDSFLDRVCGKSDDAPLVGASEAAYRNQVMEAIYQGAKESRWVRL